MSRLRKLASAGACFIGAFLAGLLIVPLFAPFWHMVFGDFFSYSGWHSRVPRTFFVQGSHTMWALSLGVPVFQVPSGQISFDSRAVDQAFDFARGYPVLEKSVLDHAIQNGYELKAHRALKVDGQETRCWEFARSKAPQSMIRCVVEDRGKLLALFFEGDPRYVPDFFSTLQGMSRLAPK